MHRSPAGHRRLAVGLLALAALVAACGGTTTPNASTASTAPGGTTAPAASGGAAGGSTGGSLLDVTIAAPYTLAELPADKAATVQAGIEKDLGAYGKAVHVNVQSVEQGGTSAAYLMVVAFPQGTLNDTIYNQILTDLSMGAESNFTPQLVSGVPVAFGSLNGGSVAVFRKGDLAFITMAPQTTDLSPVVGALVKVNG